MGLKGWEEEKICLKMTTSGDMQTVCSQQASYVCDGPTCGDPGGTWKAPQSPAPSPPQATGSENPSAPIGDIGDWNSTNIFYCYDYY